MIRRPLIVLLTIVLPTGCGEPTAPLPVFGSYALVTVDSVAGEYLVTGEGPDSLFLGFGSLQLTPEFTFWAQWGLRGTGSYPERSWLRDGGTYEAYSGRATWPPDFVEFYLRLFSDTGRGHDSAILRPTRHRAATDTLIVWGGPFRNVMAYAHVRGWYFREGGR